MIENIALLVIGGVITFLFTFVYRRLTQRSVHLTWRILPPVHLPSLELVAFNVIAANRGNDVAKNVRVIIALPQNSEIGSLEIQPSEAALRYSLNVHKEEKNKIDVEFPFFQSGVDCVFSFLARKSVTDGILVSIVAEEDTIGEPEKSFSPHETERLSRRIRYTSAVTTGFIVLFALIFSLWIVIVGNSRRDYMHQMDVGDLYYETGQYQKALEQYSKVPDKWYIPNMNVLRYRLARTYAQLNNPLDAVEYLMELQEHGAKDLAAYAITDPSFKSIAKSKVFLEFIEEVKKQ